MSQPRCPEHRIFLAAKDGKRSLPGHYWCHKCGLWWQKAGDGQVRAAKRIKCQIQQLMEEANLDRQALAEQIGVSYRITCKIVKGDTQMVRFDTMLRLCQVFQCQPGDLWPWAY